MVYDRISVRLFEYQSRDQHAFTPSVRIEDALLCAEASIQYALEFNVPLWLSSMDLRKAFDTVDHTELFRALGHHGLDPAYIELLKRLYSGQTGSANGSRTFNILCGVRQGDVLSAIIFNCVLDIALESWKTSLVREGLLLEGDSERLTNTRYADDILLYAKSLQELCRMAESLIRELQKVGLHLNADKSRILHSSSEDEGANKDYVEISGEFVRVLHGNNHHRYLGRQLCLSAAERVSIEFIYRKKQAWGTFFKHKKILLNKNVSLQKRLKFFDSCITPTVLFSLSVFPLGKVKIDDLDRLQRKMLRRIVGWRRIPEETWESTMIRMNIRLENAQNLFHCQPWSRRWARGQWKYACHLASKNCHSWAKTLTLESTLGKNDVFALYVPHRSVGRPRLRWDDYLRHFFHDYFPLERHRHWLQICSCISNEMFEDMFVNYVVSSA